MPVSADLLLYIAPVLPFVAEVLDHPPFWKKNANRKRAFARFLAGVVSLALALLMVHLGLRAARANGEEETAKYMVEATSHTHPPKDSREVRQRIDQFLDALRRTKRDKRGTAIIRQDGSIGVDWSVSIDERLGINTGR
jgi:hypothetical protein